MQCSKAKWATLILNSSRPKPPLRSARNIIFDSGHRGERCCAGGLWPKPTHLPPEMRQYIRQADARIAQISGQRLGRHRRAGRPAGRPLVAALARAGDGHGGGGGGNPGAPSGGAGIPGATGAGPGGGPTGTVVGGPSGIVMPGATSMVGWMTVSDGGGGVGDGGGGACGTPA